MIGKKVQDIWDFKDPAHPSYPTEKNQDMLRFIIESSSAPGSIVLDCFCGSGTTLLAANHCNRRWIGIDQSPLATRVIKNNFQKTGDSHSITYDFISLKEGIRETNAILR